MRTMRPRSLVALLAVCAVAGVTAGSGSGSALRLDERVHSRALGGTMHALVVLPPGYWHERTRRYPVVYFLHGLPAGSTSYRDGAWLGAALAKAGRAILVVPQGARDGDSDPEYLDWGGTRNWQTYVAEELPQWVDTHFRTIRARDGRALIGISAGGYGATVSGVNHLGTFSVIESWSGYFEPTNPAGTAPIDGGPNSDVHRLVGELATAERALSTYLAFYVGDNDRRFRADDVRFDRQLTSAGVGHRFAVYPGGHSQSVWRQHAVDWLGAALAHLAR